MSSNQTAFYESPIGTIKIMANDHFISELAFINEEDIQVEEASSLLPVLAQCKRELTEFFSGERKRFTIPVNQSGTQFQQKVWSELMQIPFGKTVSYLSLSKRLGDVNAIRAVAASNGKNKVSIIIPCHRVIGSDNSLVGYAWGAWRKKWLLAHEAKWQNGVQTLF